MIYNNLYNLDARYKASITEAINIILDYKINSLNEIILFGSCARLNIHVNSDIDIAIITSESIHDRSLRGSLRSDLETLSTKIKCDLTLMTNEIMNNQDNINRLRDVIRNEGIILWKDGKCSNDYKQLLRSSNE